MEYINCEISNHSEIIDAKRTTLIHIQEKFDVEKVNFKGNTRISEILSTNYESELERRNPSNEQAFLNISGGFLELAACLETTGPNLSLIEQEIQFMETIIDSTTDSSIKLFVDHAKRVSNLLEEVVGKNTQSNKIIMDLLKDFIVISES